MARSRFLLRLGGSAYPLLVFTAALWGGNAVAGRLAVGEVSPMAITALRWIIVVGVLAGIGGRSVLAEWRVLAPDWPRVLLLGGLGFTSFNALFYLAAHHTSAINMGVIQGVMPALILLGGFVAYRIPIRPLQALGLAVTLVGVVVTASRGDLDVLRHLAFNVGDLWMIAATILYAGYTLGLRRRPRVSPLTFFAAMAFAALLTSLPLLAWEVASGAVQWPTPRGWVIMLFIGLFPSLIAQLLFMRGVDLIGPGRAGLFINLVPVFAALFGVVILGETFAPYHAVALALVLGGIWLAERGRGATD